MDQIRGLNDSVYPGYSTTEQVDGVSKLAPTPIYLEQKAEQRQMIRHLLVNPIAHSFALVYNEWSIENVEKIKTLERIFDPRFLVIEVPIYATLNGKLHNHTHNYIL